MQTRLKICSITAQDAGISFFVLPDLSQIPAGLSVCMAGLLILACRGRQAPTSEMGCVVVSTRARTVRLYLSESWGSNAARCTNRHPCHLSGRLSPRHFPSPDMWEGVVEERTKWTDPGISLAFNSSVKSFSPSGLSCSICNMKDISPFISSSLKPEAQGPFL